MVDDTDSLGNFSNIGFEDDLDWDVTTIDDHVKRLFENNVLTETDEYMIKWKNLNDSLELPKETTKRYVKDHWLKAFLKAALDIRGMIDVYDFLLASRLARKSPSKNLPNYRTKGLAVDMNAQYFGAKGITYYYVIEGIPRELDVWFRDNIRRQTEGNVRVHFITDMKRYNIPWDEPQFVNQLAVWKSITEEDEKKEGSVYTQHDTYRKDANKVWLGASLMYLNDAEMGNTQHFTYKTKFFMSIIGNRGIEFDNSVLSVESYCAKIGLRLRRVIYNVNEFLSYSSPFYREFNKRIDSGVPKFILTDEILGQFPTFAQGIVGDIGIYCGTDIYSQFPVVKTFKRQITDAENILFLAETGGGKSAFVKSIVTQLSCTDVYGLIFDVDGREYSGLAKLVAAEDKVAVLNLGGLAGTLGSYLDPVKIIQHIAGKEFEEDSYTMSVEITTAVYKILADDVYTYGPWPAIVISDAIAQTYVISKVKAQDRSTWHNSNDLELADVYCTMRTQLKSFNADRSYQEARELLCAKYAKYFEVDGSEAQMFAVKANIDDIIEAKLVIGAFNLEGRALNTIPRIQLNLMQQSATRLAQLRTIFARLQGKKNYKVWEEVQELMDFPDAEKAIGTALTTGRKSGDINFLISNQPSKLLHGDELGVFQNKTSIFIGAIDDAHVRQELVERLSIPNMMSELSKIARDKKKTEGTSRVTPYRYAFLAVLDGKATTVKMHLPAYIMDSELIKTGIDLVENELHAAEVLPSERLFDDTMFESTDEEGL